MPRQGRINIVGGIYHIIQRGINRQEIYSDDADRQEFLQRLANGIAETGHQCYAWVLMPNHFHLLLRTGVRPISDLMRKLLTGYALYFNKKYKRCGFLYQNRYKSILCQEEEYLLELLRYIHLNPLRAKIINEIKELDDYKWSGHGVILGKTQAVWQSRDEILLRFGKSQTEAITKYTFYIQQAKNLGKRADLTGGGLIRSVGGWQSVLNLRQSKQKWVADERILGNSDFVSETLKQAEDQIIRHEKLKQEGWNLDRLVKQVCIMFGIEEKTIMQESRRSKLAQARSLIAYWGNKELGISGVDLANYFSITKSSISSAIKRGREIADKHQYRII